MAPSTARTAATAAAAPRRVTGLCRRLVTALLLTSSTSARGSAAKGEGPLLRPESELSSNCFNFPEHNFDPLNSIEGVNDGHTPYLPMEVGVDAIDFTLHDLEGRRWNLGDMLKEKGLPVVMIWGMFTCPAFQGLGGDAPFDKCAYWDEHALVEAYKERATFVHLYGPEPHPTIPGTNFDTGTMRPEYWSVVAQQKDYPDRLVMAARVQGVIHPDQTILPDYFPGNPYSELIQPVWCTYSMGARPVTVISPEGKLIFQRGWLQTDHVRNALDTYWCEDEGTRSAVRAREEGRESDAPDDWCADYRERNQGDGIDEMGIPPLARALSETD